MSDFAISSPAFGDGETIPDRYGYEADNVNPPLTIEGVPGEAEALVLLVDDPDAKEPTGQVWDHWVVWNIPPDTTEISVDWSPSEASEGKNDYDEAGYGGPKPPDGQHTYRFRLFALSTPIELGSDATKEDVEQEMAPHVLAEAELTGTFAPQ